MDGYNNGHIKRHKGGKYEGELTIEGVDLSPIVAVFFAEGGKEYLWLKRKRIVEYDDVKGEYTTRKPNPMWECYLEKKRDNGREYYEGQFLFFHFAYNIVGVKDHTFEEQHLFNFFVERLPQQQQTIINKIKDRRNDAK